MEGALCLAARDAQVTDIHEEEVVVGAAGEDFEASLHTGRCKGLAVFNDSMGIVLECLRARFPEGNGLRCDDVGERAAHREGTALIEGFGKFPGGEYQSCPGSPEGFMGGGSHHMGKGNGVIVTGKYLTGHKACEVGHIDHKDRSDLVGNFPHSAEVDFSRIRRVASKEYEGTDFEGLFLNIIIVQKPRFF